MENGPCATDCAGSKPTLILLASMGARGDQCQEWLEVMSGIFNDWEPFSLIRGGLPLSGFS